MKQLQDYLHLYLGCECLAEVPDIEVPQKFKIDYTLLLNHTFFKNPKPILRHLSGMTGIERSELAERLPASMCNLLPQIKAGRNTELWINASVPNAFLYLLSKHFDLFGLIEAGLAIDKTKCTS